MLHFILTWWVYPVFAIEKALMWHHCRSDHCDTKKIKSTIPMILFGDGVHNFFDGVIIAASFLTNFSLGVFTTFAIILHEIPQEIGDFAILIKTEVKYKKALWYNFLSAATAIAGGSWCILFLRNFN